MKRTLEPLAGIARVTSWAVYTLVLLGVLLVLFGPGGVFAGGLRTVCTQGPFTSGVGTPFARDGVQVKGATFEACTDSPGTGMWLAEAADQWLWLVWLAGALLLLLRFLRTAAEDGPYSAAVPGRLRALGWYLPLGAAAVAAVLAVAETTMVNGMFTTTTGWSSRWGGQFPWWTVFAGAAALTFARILRIGVRMHEDLEGTV
ncbi:DUF2975 domain-containing protein [Amycolatopsis nigrescens]|uniref:DUF2975 domain-containing protein n=1 Tax=Amycolatopsis nigrescens TaxID=381445 RepID=UPI000364EBE1|nr:DUF2975 domain-containing protein [Amycolatopsis nigrescens]